VRLNAAATDTLALDGFECQSAGCDG